MSGCAGFKFEWQRAFMASDLPPMTRLVLFALCAHMDPDGGTCYPSIERLAECTGLAIRAVKAHTRKAVDSGWIERWTRQANGETLTGRAAQGWRHYQYRATLPEREEPHTAPSPNVVNPFDHVHPERGASGAPPSSERGASGAPPSSERGAYDDKNVVHHVHPIQQENNQEKTKQPSARARASGGSGGDGKLDRETQTAILRKWKEANPDVPTCAMSPKVNQAFFVQYQFFREEDWWQTPQEFVEMLGKLFRFA